MDKFTYTHAPELLNPLSEKKVDEDLDRHLFSLEEGDNFVDALKEGSHASFTVKSLNTAIHNILGSRLGVGEFFRDRYMTLYSTGEFMLLRSFLEKERSAIEKILQNQGELPESFINNSLDAIQIITNGSIHIDEIRKRYTAMKDFPEGLYEPECHKNRLGSIGNFIVPTPIEQCIGTPGSQDPIVGPGKSAQIVISTEKGSNNIAGVCITYKTPSLEEAYNNELAAHYPGKLVYIRRAMQRIYDEIDDHGVMVFPVIGMLPRYTSLRSMMRMMRDWARELISDDFAMTPGIAEMDMTNNFFDLCSRQLSVTPLTLLDQNGDPISAENKRLDYCSTVVTFRAIAAIEKARKGISSVIPRKSFNLKGDE